MEIVRLYIDLSFLIGIGFGLFEMWDISRDPIRMSLLDHFGDAMVVFVITTLLAALLWPYMLCIILYRKFRGNAVQSD